MPTPTKHHLTADRFADSLIFTIVLLGSVASLSYWIVLFTRLPAVLWYPIFAILCFVTIWRTGRIHTPSRVDGAVFVIMALCAVSACGNIFTLSPDADDFSFFQRSLVSASNMALPIPNTDSYSDVGGLPALSPLHLLTAVEFVVVFTAKALGIDSLWAIHYGFGTLAAAAIPLPYFLLIRRAGLSVRLALLGAAGALLFLVLAGSTHRDWGSFTLTRVWQGKCFLIAFILPTVILYGNDFHQSLHKSYRKLLLSTVFGLGLSTTAIFLIPFVMYPLIAWPVLSIFLGPHVVRRALPAFLPLMFLAAATLSPSLGLVPNNIQNYGVWRDLWPSDPFASVTLVVSSTTILMLAAILLLGLLVIPNRRLAALLSFGCLVWGVSVFLPPVNWLFMTIVLPGAFWRLVYAFPLPLLFGVLLAYPFHIMAHRDLPRMALAGVGCVVLALFCLTARPALDRDNLSWPQTNKLSPHNSSAMTAMMRSAPEKAVILAPEDVVVSLGLLRPDLRWIWVRETLHVFRNAGRQAEGQAREAARKAVAECLPFDITTAPIAARADLIVYQVGCAMPPETSLGGRSYDPVMISGYPALRARPAPTGS